MSSPPSPVLDLMTPTAELVDALEQPGLLGRLCGPRVRGEHNVRECGLERIVAEVVSRTMRPQALAITPLLGEALALSSPDYPAATRPDIVASYADGCDVIEVKSGRTDYGRFDCVVGKGMRGYLAQMGEPEAHPWEVEQDLLRLLHVLDVVPRVRSAQLILLDAYQGRGRSWTNAFATPEALASIVRTARIRREAPRLVESTRIVSLHADGIHARLIHCVLSR